MGDNATITPPTSSNSSKSRVTAEIEEDSVAVVWTRTGNGWQTEHLEEGEDMSVFDEHGNHIVKVEVNE